MSEQTDTEEDPIDDSALSAMALLDPPAATTRERAGGSTAAGVVLAAMLGIAEVLEPEKTSADIEIVAEAPDDEPLIDLDLQFGDLPSLDP